MKLEGLSIVGRKRVKPSGDPISYYNPATGAPLEPAYHHATTRDAKRATQLAAEAFAVYGRWTGKQKAVLLRRIAELLEANGPAVQERAHQETALPSGRLQGETARTVGQLRLFANLIEEGSWVGARIDHADPNRKPLPKPDLRMTSAPLGPVVVFSSSNFPFAYSIVGGDTASALAAGCPVILKPHQGHPGTSEMVAQLAQQAVADCHAPEGVFSMLYGPGAKLGIALVKDPVVKAVGFTGSRLGGRALMDAAAKRPEPMPVYAEMGSINPVFLLKEVLQQKPEELAAGQHNSFTLGVGQFCTNPGLVIMEDGPAAQLFLQKLESLSAATPSATMLNPGLCAAFRDGVAKFSKIPGVRHAVSVNAEPGVGNAQAGVSVFVTDAANFLANPSLMDEVFGPSTLIVLCALREQMLAAAAKLEGQLTATIHGTDADVAASRDLIAILEGKAGRLIYNGFPTGVEVCHAMVHGGPYPATADGRSTSVGSLAIHRFVRPVCYQNYPDSALPSELQESNPLGITRLVDGTLTK
jgi:NADP-dependent aldehyde dehydrogenase